MSLIRLTSLGELVGSEKTDQNYEGEGFRGEEQAASM